MAVKRITSLKVVRPGVARATFATGEVREIEWKRFANEGPVFARLTDPEYSDKFKLILNGYAVVWHDGMDWDAGAVYKDSKPVTVHAAAAVESVRPLRIGGKPLFTEKRAATRKIAAKLAKPDTSRPANGKLQASAKLPEAKVGTKSPSSRVR